MLRAFFFGRQKQQPSTSTSAATTPAPAATSTSAATTLAPAATTDTIPASADTNTITVPTSATADTNSSNTIFPTSGSVTYGPSHSTSTINSSSTSTSTIGSWFTDSSSSTLGSFYNTSSASTCALDSSAPSPFNPFADEDFRNSCRSISVGGSPDGATSDTTVRDIGGEWSGINNRNDTRSDKSTKNMGRYYYDSDLGNTSGHDVSHHKALLSSMPPHSQENISICNDAESKTQPASTKKKRPNLKPLSLKLSMPPAQEEKYHSPDENDLKDNIGKIEIDGTIFAIGKFSEEFEIKEELGQGNFGCVRAARHIPSNTELAIKYLRHSMNPEQRKQLMRELSLTRKFSSDYIVKYYGMNIADGEVQLFVERMCMSLDGVIKVSKQRKQIVPQDILGAITCALINGMDYMWDKHRAMHRDIKPSNALVGWNSSIKLCDFGLTNIAQDSMLISNVGSELYLSPEQLDPSTCNQAYDVRRDIWSLGVTLLEIANLKYPFCSTEDSPIIFDVMQKVKLGEIPEISNEYSSGFKSLALSCLEVDVLQRPFFREPALPSRQPGVSSTRSCAGTSSNSTNGSLVNRFSTEDSTSSFSDSVTPVSLDSSNPGAISFQSDLTSSNLEIQQRRDFHPQNLDGTTHKEVPVFVRSGNTFSLSPIMREGNVSLGRSKFVHPALMEQPFYRKYQREHVDVRSWLDSLL